MSAPLRASRPAPCCSFGQRATITTLASRVAPPARRQSNGSAEPERHGVGRRPGRWRGYCPLAHGSTHWQQPDEVRSVSAGFVDRPDRFPRASRYNPEWVLASASGGAHALWLTEWLAEAIELRAAMRVPHLGCGRAAA